ncbi:MAG: hypothetical protein JNM69_33530 [Archangium sp.]|nr:hypothetical protein [Archangium sp.]
MEELNTVLAKVGGWKSVGFAVAVIVVLIVLKRLFSSSAPSYEGEKRRVMCGCGWQGSVTKMKPRCPMCGRTELHDV